MASVRRLNRARPLILICTCVLVSQLGVFICLQIGRLGMRGIKRVKERDWKSERGKDRERVGRREGSGWNPDVSQLPEWEREREGERDRALRYHSLLEWIPPLHIQHTHTHTHRHSHTPLTDTSVWKSIFSLLTTFECSFSSYLCLHSLVVGAAGGVCMLEWCFSVPAMRAA